MRARARFALAAVALLVAAGGAAGKGTADPVWDVVLGSEDWGAENASGSPESKRDQRLMEALEHAFPGEAVSYGRLGGERWAEVIDVTCDRPHPRCQATGVVDLAKLNEPEGMQRPIAAGNAAAALIRALDGRGLCDSGSCKAGAIACFWNRHDDYDGHIGAYTCRYSRKPVPPPPPVQE